MESKFIRLKGLHDSSDTFILFPMFIQHGQMVRDLLVENKGLKVISAGFCYVNNASEYTCSGRSISLGCKSIETDSDALTRQMRGY